MKWIHRDHDHFLCLLCRLESRFDCLDMIPDHCWQMLPLVVAEEEAGTRIQEPFQAFTASYNVLLTTISWLEFTANMGRQMSLKDIDVEVM